MKIHCANLNVTKSNMLQNIVVLSSRWHFVPDVKVISEYKKKNQWLGKKTVHFSTSVQWIIQIWFYSESQPKTQADAAEPETEKNLAT